MRCTKKVLIVGCCLFVILLFTFPAISPLVHALKTETVTVGGTPQAIAITPDGKYAYVPNQQNVVVINTATNKVGAVVPVESWPAGIAITPNGKYAYVTSLNNATFQGSVVSVIDTSTNKVTLTINVGGDPNEGVAITPDGKYVYATNIDGAVAVIATATNSIVANITLAPLVASSQVNSVVTIPGASMPQAVAITPDGKYAYVARGDDAISVINTATYAVTATINVTGQVDPNDIAISPDGGYAYVCGDNSDNGTVLTISTATNKVTAAVTGFDCPNDITIAPDGKYAYVTNNWDDYVSVVNLTTDTIDGTIKVGTSPYGVAVTPNGRYVYVTNLDYKSTGSPSVIWDGTVSIIDTTTNTVIAAGSSASSKVLEFSSQLIIIIALICVIIALSIIIAAMKFAEKTKSTKLSLEEQTEETQSANQVFELLFLSGAI